MCHLKILLRLCGPSFNKISPKMSKLKARTDTHTYTHTSTHTHTHPHIQGSSGHNIFIPEMTEYSNNNNNNNKNNHNNNNNKTTTTTTKTIITMALKIYLDQCFHRNCVQKVYFASKYVIEFMNAYLFVFLFNYLILVHQSSLMCSLHIFSWDD